MKEDIANYIFNSHRWLDVAELALYAVRVNPLRHKFQLYCPQQCWTCEGKKSVLLIDFIGFYG